MTTVQKPVINLSINPSYFCNLRCKHCYLTPEQLSDKLKLSMYDLDMRLNEIKLHGFELGHVDIYGGEVMILPSGYVQEMKGLLNSHGIEDIEIITNLTALNKAVVEDGDLGISVSYDFVHRERHGEVFENMINLSKPFTVLTLATPEVIELDVDVMISELNILGQLRSWEIKPYSPNQANQSKITHRQYEEFVKRIIASSVPKRFEFRNETLLKQVVKGQGHSYSDDHVYITPSGHFAVLEFDLNGNEYFKELESFSQYLQWCEQEHDRVSANTFCQRCEFSGKCLSEHLREVSSLDESCNGFHNLIQHYKERVKENKKIKEK